MCRKVANVVRIAMAVGFVFLGLTIGLIAISVPILFVLLAAVFIGAGYMNGNGFQLAIGIACATVAYVAVYFIKTSHSDA